MKVSKISIKNFRGICEAELFLPAHGVLIGDNNTGFFNPAVANTLALANNGVETVRFSGDGSVGIGDTTPDYLLDVAGTLGVDGAATLSSTLGLWPGMSIR